MAYVVYVNHPNNYATVHDTTCGKYTNRRRDKTRSGFWSEPFPTREQALGYARSAGKRDVDTCALCL
jgi:hypothetical protein